MIVAMQELQEQIELSMDLGKQTIEALARLLEVFPKKKSPTHLL